MFSIVVDSCMCMCVCSNIYAQRCALAILTSSIQHRSTTFVVEFLQMVSMKVTKLGMKKQQMQSILKKPSAAKSVPSTSDSLWDTDPSLAASLALVPLDQRESGLASVLPGPVENIPRELPPALVSMKVSGEWGKDQMSAVGNYLQSLSTRFGWDTSKLQEEYSKTRGAAKREFAMKLALATDSGMLKAIENETVTTRTEGGSIEGWRSAFQIWAMEDLPLCKETMKTRLAVLAPLEKRPHRNPLRAEMGELEFKYHADTMKTTKVIHNHSFSAKHSDSFKSADDMALAKKNIKRQAGIEDVKDSGSSSTGGDGTAVQPRKPKKPKIDPSTLAGKALQDYNREENKKMWLKDAHSYIGKLSAFESKLGQLISSISSAEGIPKKLATDAQSSHDKVIKAKQNLNAKLGLKDSTQAASFAGKPFTDALSTAKNLEETLNKDDSIIKRAQRAVNLARC